MLTSGPRYGTWRGTVLTSSVLDRHSITVMSKAERYDDSSLKSNGKHLLIMNIWAEKSLYNYTAVLKALSVLSDLSVM